MTFRLSLRGAAEAIQKISTGLRLLAVTAFLLSIPVFSYASGWTQKSGKGLVIQNNVFYYNTSFFDESGKNKSLGGYYRKYELNPYLEYGVTDDITIGANLFFERAEQKKSSGYFANYGVGDSELFARFKLYKNSGFAVALEPMLKIPSLASNKSFPQIGSDDYDTGLTLSAGYGFSAFGNNHFINIDAGYRHRLGAPHDQLKFSATAGISLYKNLQILSQIFVTERTGSQKQNIFTLAPSDDYNETKLELSALYKLTDDWAVQAGVFKDVSGRNVGDGRGGIFSIHKSF